MILFKKLRDVLIKTRYLVFKLERIRVPGTERKRRGHFLVVQHVHARRISKGSSYGRP